MIHTIRLAAVLGFACACLFASEASAAGAVGAWLVKDKAAIIRIADCDGALWGVVAWEAFAGVDDHNPDPAKKTRPTLGMPVLVAMHASGDHWEGHIYNARNGNTYTSNIALVDGDKLRVRGCVLGFLCGGEDWTRADPAQTTLKLNDEALCAAVDR
jgi:uncharacterized protein (DUF2147 family)